MSMHYRVKRRCSKLLHNAELLCPQKFKQLYLGLTQNKRICNLFDRIISLCNNLLPKY